MLIFTGCEKNDYEIKPQNVFNKNFLLNYNSLQIKGKLNVNEKQNLIISIESPAALKSMKVFVSKENIKVLFKGMNTEFKNENIPESAFFRLIPNVFDIIFNDDSIQFSKQNDKYFSEINSSLGLIKIILDEKYFISSIKISNQGFTLTLK